MLFQSRTHLALKIQWRRHIVATVSSSSWHSDSKVILQKPLRYRNTSSWRIQNPNVDRYTERLISSTTQEEETNDPRKTTTTTTTTTKLSSTTPSTSTNTTAQSFWQQVQSPPNAITLARMAATPLLAYWVISEEYLFAIAGCSLAAASDYLDGYLAKRYGWTTVLGTYLDPLADKAFVNTIGISLWYSGVLPTPLVVVWATKDVMLLTGTAWYLYQKHGSVSFVNNSVSKEPLKVTPSMIAKVNTTLQFSTLVVGLMSPVVALPPILLNSLCWITAGTTIGSTISYATRAGMGDESQSQ